VTDDRQRDGEMCKRVAVGEICCITGIWISKTSGPINSGVSVNYLNKRLLSSSSHRQPRQRIFYTINLFSADRQICKRVEANEGTQIFENRCSELQNNPLGLTGDIKSDLTFRNRITAS